MLINDSLRYFYRKKYFFFLSFFFMSENNFFFLFRADNILEWNFAQKAPGAKMDKSVFVRAWRNFTISSRLWSHLLRFSLSVTCVCHFNAFTRICFSFLFPTCQIYRTVNFQFVYFESAFGDLASLMSKSAPWSMFDPKPSALSTYVT